MTHALAQAAVTGLTGYEHHDVEDALREAGPLHHAVLPSGLRVQLVTAGCETSRALLTDPRLSKDSTRLLGAIQAQLGPTEVTGMHGPSMVMSDPPRHTRLRRLVAGEFTTRRALALRPRIEELTADLVDAIPTGRPVDLVRTMAFPLPITVICELLGVPRQDHGPIRAWTERLMHDDPAITLPASRQMTDHLSRLSPQPGTLLGALARQSPADEVVTMAMLLVVAGHETTTNLISNTVYALLSPPERWRAAADDPALVPAAIDETLRWDPPVKHATHRVSTEPVDVDGHVLPPGEVVLVNLGAAGRDPHTTAHAGQFDLHRPARQHVAFGHGTHFCLGASLARLEAEICLTQLTSRWRAPQLTHRPRRTDSAIMNGLRELVITV